MSQFGYQTLGFGSKNQGLAPTKVRVLQGQIAADTTPLDLTETGRGTPTGCIVFGTYATALNTQTAHAAISVGVSDFTTTAASGTNSEDAIALGVGDMRTVHQEVDVLEWYDVGKAIVDRSLAITAISDGIRLTPNESGTQYQVSAIVFWGTGCKAFSAGAGTTADNTYAVTHGFGSKPKAGIFATCGKNETNGEEYAMSLGFFTDTGSIAQANSGVGSSQAPNPTDAGGQVQSDRVAVRIHPTTGATINSAELTANDSTSTTFTTRTFTSVGDVIGLLLELPDVDAYLEIVDTPTDEAFDWTESGAGFTPQAVLAVLGAKDTTDLAISSGQAAPLGLTAFDDQNAQVSISATHKFNVATTVAKSYTNNKIFQTNNGGGDAYDLAPASNPMNANGFTFANADITLLTSSPRYWPMLFIEKTQVVPRVNHYYY